MRVSILKPTHQNFKEKPVFGFDIETTGQKNRFYCGSVWNENQDFQKTFFKKSEMIEHFKQKRFKDSIVCATNLAFDFFGIMHDEEDKNFNTLFRGSDLLFAKTYLKNGRFNIKYSNGSQRLLFLDTMNYAQLSVEKLGKLINIPKLKKPICLGRLPDNDAEKEELIIYNMRDSEVSALGLKFLLKAFRRLGASFRPTIASTSMSLYKNYYLKNDYFRHSPKELDEQFNAYYGGRTEAFARGKIEDYFYYDVNSLYPFVMSSRRYPDPNSKRITNKNTTEYIHEYEGCSDITIFIPETEFPILPYRFENKLLFPYGTFRGWYSHVELREAIKRGATIKEVHRTYYFKETVDPFSRFIKDMYNKRMEYKKENNPMEYVVKILMNSLYGKFGQKFRNKDNWIPFPETIEELDKYDFFERFGNFIRVKQDYTEPSNFCIPIWALYTTSYARLHLHSLIERASPVYVDTDSLMTKKKMITGDDLGQLKLEMKINEGIVCKPKMYCIKGSKGDVVKIKGVGTRLSINDFIKLISLKKVNYTKFMRFKESMRREMDINEIVDMVKNFDLEDNKRNWNGQKFNIKEIQYSKAINTQDLSRNKSETFINQVAPLVLNKT